VTLLLLFTGGLTTYLPQASLAAAVIVAGTSLFDLEQPAANRSSGSTTTTARGRRRRAEDDAAPTRR